MATSKSANTYNRQNWEDAVSILNNSVVYGRPTPLNYVGYLMLG